MIRLRYGNTNTFFLPGAGGGLLVDTDWAGTMPAFYKALKAAGIGIGDISYVLATHFHPDHCGLVGELQGLGVTLLLMDVQQRFVRFSEEIFARDRRISHKPVDKGAARVISCGESRLFLRTLGIDGEIVSTPSHSPDSVTVILDTGDFLVGDLEPMAYLAAYEDNPQLEQDWAELRRHNPKRIFYAHANESVL